MTDIEKRINELEKKIAGDNRTGKEIEAERITIEKAERKAKERLRRISRSRNES